MADYHAIGAVSQALRSLLRDSRPRPEFDGAEVELAQLADMKAGKIAEGLSLVLYRVAVNGTRRTQPARVGLDGVRRRPALPVDLHYLICAHGRTVEKQLHVLGWCLRTLHDTPSLPITLLNQFVPEEGRFSPSETVELVAEPLSLQDNAQLIDDLRGQLSLAYVARMVLIESALRVHEYEPVQTRVLDIAAEQAG